MALIFESDNFQIIAADKPHVSRTDGGHLLIAPKVPIEDRTKLSRKAAIELMKLTMVAGEAMKNALAKKGIEIGRINYQDNGNWTHKLHIHLYGRARGATVQKYGTPLSFPATQTEFEQMESPEPLSEGDVTAIRDEVIRLLNTEKYKDF
ncbi:MAG: HIT domain-containing protein [Candidatus Sungiibacteriota bacterium]